MSFITFLLWTPFRLVIDSKNDVYKLEWQSLVSALLIEKEGRLGVQFQILFFKKTVPLASLFKKKVKSSLRQKNQSPPQYP